VFRASKTVRQNSLTFCQTILDDDLPLPSGSDLEQAYRIAGPKQYKGRLRDVFMILSDDYFNNKAQVVKETSQSQPAVEQMDTSNQKPSGSSQAKPPAQGKPNKTNNKRKNSQGYMSVDGVHKLSRM
jgi:hypothetical protein